MAAIIRDSIEIAAPAASVFAALTTPHELLAWWTTAGSRPLAWQMDLRVGGRWSSRWRPDGGGEFSIAGRVLELRAPHLLVVSWTDERYPDAPETRVRYEIVETPHGCQLSLEHSGFTSAEADNYADYNGGWTRVVPSLDAPNIARARAAVIAVGDTVIRYM